MIADDHPLRRLARPLSPLATGRQSKLRRLDDIDAVIWDVYGTLVISGTGDVGSADESAHARALIDAVRAVGLPEPDDASGAAAALRDQIHRAQDAVRRRGATQPEVDILSVWRGWWSDFVPGRRAAPGQIVRLALEFEARANPTWPMPGAAEVVGELAARGVRQGIVSNAQFFTLELLEISFGRPPQALGFDPDLCLFSYRYGEAKPAAALFDSLVAELARQSMPAARSLYIGNDMRNDVAAAARAGLRTALFSGEARSLRLRRDDPEVAGCQPDVELTELPQLLECLPTTN